MERLWAVWGRVPGRTGDSKEPVGSPDTLRGKVAVGRLGECRGGGGGGDWEGERAWEGTRRCSPARGAQQCNPHDGLMRALLRLCPFFRCGNWGKVTSPPTSRIWGAHVLGTVAGGQRKGLPAPGGTPLPVRSCSAAEGAQLPDEHRSGTLRGPCWVPAGDCGPRLGRITGDRVHPTHFWGTARGGLLLCAQHSPLFLRD